mmetsp:Transcript_31624/g.72173  ORF Transcript_31624/g.72173 Transcript_31624/m.72173 type:complete len:472 (-) Transcript_31624:73-1488(-)
MFGQNTGAGMFGGGGGMFGQNQAAGMFGQNAGGMFGAGGGLGQGGMLGQGMMGAAGGQGMLGLGGAAGLGMMGNQAMMGQLAAMSGLGGMSPVTLLATSLMHGNMNGLSAGLQMMACNDPYGLNKLRTPSTPMLPPTPEITLTPLTLKHEDNHRRERVLRSQTKVAPEGTESQTPPTPATGYALPPSACQAPTSASGSNQRIGSVPRLSPVVSPQPSDVLFKPWQRHEQRDPQQRRRSRGESASRTPGSGGPLDASGQSPTLSPLRRPSPSPRLSPQQSSTKAFIRVPDDMPLRFNGLPPSAVGEDYEDRPPTMTLSVVPRLARPGYSCKPSIQELSLMTEAELSKVDSFEIHRESYGWVRWEGLTDLRHMDLDAVVSIESRQLIMYPLGSVPPVGHGLNKQAVVCLIVTPTATMQKQRTRAEIQALVRELTESLGGQLLSYDMKHWIFRMMRFDLVAGKQVRPSQILQSP